MAHLMALCVDAHDPLGLARFWSGVLGWEMLEDAEDEIALLPERRHRVPDPLRLDRRSRRRVRTRCTST